MKNWKIPLYKIDSTESDIRIISKVIKRGMDWASGPEVETFEKSLANYVGSKYCITFNSGTSALHASLLALDLKGNNEIIVPSFSFISTANCTLMVNAIPRFADIEMETYGIDPYKVKTVISKKTKAIIPVHYSGIPCKIHQLEELTNSKKIIMIEDCAESLGSSINNRKVGTFGKLSIFSFAANKVLTTGEGGAITTNSKKLFEKLKLIRSHGRLEIKNYFSTIEKPNYIQLGYNWRMSSITAALGISQLERIEKLIILRRKNAHYISRELQKFKQISVPKEPSGYRHVYQLYSIEFHNFRLRNKMMRHLAKKGIMSKVYFDPIHLTKYYKKMGYGKIKLDVTENISKKILSLPIYPGLTKEEMNYMIDSIKEFMEEEKNQSKLYF